MSKVTEGPGVGAKKLVEEMRETAKRGPASPETIWFEGARNKERKEKEAAERASRVEKKEEPAPSKETESREIPHPAQEVEGDEPSPEFDRAKTALIRSGFKNKELSSMSREEILKRGLVRARALDADDAAHELAKTSKEQPTKTETTTPGKQDKVELPDLKTALAPLAKQLLLDEDGATALEKTFKDILTPIVSRIEAKPQDAPKADPGILRSVEATRKELSGEYPQLVDPRIFESVVEQMDTFALKSPKYRAMSSAEDAFRALMQDACTVLGLEREEVEKTDRNGEDDRNLRRYSRSTPTGRAMTRTTTANPDRSAFDHIRANPGDVRGAQRALGRS